jgi:hypothetical protein
MLIVEPALKKSELAVFEEIIECPRCLVSENICDYHAKVVRNILIKEAKVEIDKLSVNHNGIR